jgi:hypothetical protein
MYNVYAFGRQCWNFQTIYGARNKVGKGFSYRPAMQATQPGGIGSLESILGLLKILKIRAENTREVERKMSIPPNPMECVF